MHNRFANLSAEKALKATPVSVGRIVAKVCVAPNLEDAVNIEVGFQTINYTLNDHDTIL